MTLIVKEQTISTSSSGIFNLYRQNRSNQPPAHTYTTQTLKMVLINLTVKEEEDMHRSANNSSSDTGDASTTPDSINEFYIRFNKLNQSGINP